VEDDRHLVIAVRTSDATVIAGVSIFDKSTISARPTTADDSTKVLD